jgi:hypothetical protein
MPSHAFYAGATDRSPQDKTIRVLDRAAIDYATDRLTTKTFV